MDGLQSPFPAQPQDFWHKQASFLITSHLSTGGRHFCGQRWKWPGSKTSPELDVLDWHRRKHLSSHRSCRECLQNSPSNFTHRNVLWVAFPARTNSSRMEVRKIIPSTIHQALYYNTWILHWWEDARTKGSLKSLPPITAFLPLMLVFPPLQVLQILCKQCQGCTMSLTLETWQHLQVNVSGVTEGEL